MRLYMYIFPCFPLLVGLQNANELEGRFTLLSIICMVSVNYLDEKPSQRYNFFRLEQNPFLPPQTFFSRFLGSPR